MGSLLGKKGNRGTLRRALNPDSVAMVAKKKKLQELKKKSYAEAKKLKKMQKANKTGQAKNLQLL